ncbi:hypothetical protein [Paenibacillus sp. FJAT-26967]|uniref:hypothetical protein n=1 Tax=Paenibacillus sp. FJAT-26967 TaxID=1729690 RepID=UPI000838861A|nr:hypothetical protein [Paenibacillus sp. FJAT-26967]
MKSLDLVYCIHCGSIVSRTQADKIFKTGFYRVSIPLASCKSCVTPISNSYAGGTSQPNSRAGDYAAPLPLMA